MSSSMNLLVGVFDNATCNLKLLTFFITKSEFLALFPKYVS